MAAATDKARFYLEKYVPELREYESKGLFSRDEIASITAKRSDFEHTLNARGSTPADYARYATYEMNLDALRKKRCKRLGVKDVKTFNGQRTVFFVLKRATEKFPGDMGLWIQYVNFCKKEQANKKLAQVFTSVLRLHPREWNLWVLAAKHYAETQGDMGTARSYMQRGLRFCKDQKRLWLEYAKLEMVYLAKIAARRKILGLDGRKGEEQAVEGDENELKLPSVTAADFEDDAGKGVEEVNVDLLQRLANAPAFTGGIPIAIFDAAMKEFKDKSPEVAEDFFDLISTFTEVSATPSILQHTLQHLHTVAKISVETIICEAKYEIFKSEIELVDFPSALGQALKTVKSGTAKLPDKKHPELSEKVIMSLLPLLRTPASEEMDDDVVKVIEASIRRHHRSLASAPKKPGKKPAAEALLTKLSAQGREQDIQTLQKITSG